MNQTFSWSRFGRLARTYFSDNRRALLINVALLLSGLIVLALLTYSGYPRTADQNRYVVLFFIGWAAWYVFTVQQVAALNEKERAITYLLRPASHLEKYLLIVLVSGVGFLVLYLTVFTLIDAVGVYVVNHREWSPNALAQIRRMGLLQIYPFYDERSTNNLPTELWVFTFFLHAIALTSALVIRRYTLALIVVLIIGSVVLSMVGNNLFLSALTGPETVSSRLPFSKAFVYRPGDSFTYRVIDLPQPIGDQIRYLVGFTALVLLYVTAYYRLKEREV